MGGSNRKGVLVTGACGFIGSHLCERLVREKYGVTAIDSITDYYDRNIKWQNLEKVKKNPNLHFRKLDVLDVDHIDNSIEYVFHAAAQPGVRASWGKDFDTYARDNILATQHILELCKEKKELKKFIYSSSSSIYGDAETYPTKEETIPKPVSPYGVTKLAGEHLCQLYHKNYGIPVVCLRYFTVFGPRQRPDMAFHKFIKAMLNNEPIMVFGDGEQTRDFTYVADVIEANMLAMQKSTTSTVFNIGGGNYATINQVIDILSDIMGEKAQVDYREKAKGDVRNTKADITRAHEELGFSPKYDLNYGLEREIEWIKSIYNLK